MNSKKISSLTRTALLAAITVLLAATPLGYIPAGVLSFTIMVLPVAIAGGTLDLNGALICGLAFGITSFFKAPSEALGQLILAYSGIMTAVICIIPRVCVGLFAGLAGKFARSRKNAAGYFILGLGSSVVNTVLFLGLLYIFCGQLVTGAFGVAVWSTTLAGGAVEAVANGILCAAVMKAAEKAHII